MPAKKLSLKTSVEVMRHIDSLLMNKGGTYGTISDS